MRKEVVEFLICPGCLPAERPLALSVDEVQGEDVLTGQLGCSSCHRAFSIRDGIAELLPDIAPSPGFDRYETAALTASYLWGHFSDLMDDPLACTAYDQWRSLLSGEVGPALDIGCAVGRLTFELAAVHPLAIGIDRSRSLVGMARELLRHGELRVDLPQQGHLSEPWHISLPAEWRSRPVEFVVADALALPFRRSLFGQVTTLNILDKVPAPLTHLQEVNRVARTKGSSWLLADPFSWSEEVTPEQDWLGGSASGPWSGPALDVLQQLLSTGQAGIIPAWKIVETGEVWWKLRTHRNHFELIRSEYLHARR